MPSSSAMHLSLLSLLFLGFCCSELSAGEPVRLIASDPALDFGYSLSVDADVMVVGAPAGSNVAGAAYVFRRLGANWEFEAKLLPPGSQPGDGFGRSVAVSGNVIIVGMPEARGIVIYRFNGSIWSQELWNFGGFGFGYEVAIHENVAVVSAPSLSSARVYEYGGAVWTLRHTLSTGGAPDFRWLAIDDQRIVAGGDQHVTIFRKDAATWVQEQILTIPGLSPDADFGSPVALDGSNLLVGASRENDRGAVYWFRLESGVWNLAQRIPAHPTVGGSAVFGSALGIMGDTAVIGAPGDRGASGSAWMYRLCGDSWAPEQRLEIASLLSGSLLGVAVGVWGSDAVIGAPGDHGSALDSYRGAAYVFPVGADCDDDNQPDGCALLEGSAFDCNQNLVLDHCEPSDDCNGNGVQDFCDLASQTSEDCNRNGVPDECDIESGDSLDLDADGILDDCFVVLCEDPAAPPTFALKAVAQNSVRFPPADNVFLRDGDVLDVDIIVMCWAPELSDIATYQVSIDLQNTGQSGAYGRILPVGWDGPSMPDPCPCSNPLYPICAVPGCVSDNQPGDGLFIDVSRDDFLLSGQSPLTAIDMSSLSRIRFGGTSFADNGVIDEGIAKYAGSLRLKPSPNACGTFVLPILSDPLPHPGDCSLRNTILRTSTDVSYCASVESLVIHVCDDDGLHCNGLETCDPDLGCQIIPPPSCDDGVACTVDSCDEAADGCAHALNHTACDDGDVCTRDECTPGGCVNIDDLCGDIPTASHWGLAVLALCLLIAAKVRFRPRMV